MNLITLIYAAAVTAFGAVGAPPTPPPVLIDDIRMCATNVEKNACVIDNPVFALADENIYISVSSQALAPGDQVRFSWYRQNTEIFISDFLGSVFETVTASASANAHSRAVLSRFPSGVPLKAGVYEVVVHPPGGARPVLKSFRVTE